MKFINIVLLIICFSIQINKGNIYLDRDEVNDEGIEITYANFGFIPYGSEIKGKIQKNQNPNGYICSPDDVGELDIETKGNFYISNRAPQDLKNCSVAHQAYYLQEKGVKVLIIKDRENRPLQGLLIDDSEDTYQDKVRIPVIVINETMGTLLEDILQQGQEVSITIVFESPKKADIVKMVYYFNGFEDKSYQFLDNFYDVYKEIWDCLDFSPRFVLQLSKDISQQYLDDCMFKGKYCTFRPNEQMIKKQISGENVLSSYIYQMCIFDNLGSKIWWEFARDFHTQCLNSDIKGNQLNLCAKDIIVQTYSFSTAPVQTCYDSSFTDNDNTILKRIYIQLIQDQINHWPGLRVNNQEFRGSLKDYLPVSEFVCSSYTDTQIPPYCRQQWGQYIPQQDAEIGISREDEEKNRDLRIIYIIIAIFFVTSLASIYFYRRSLKINVEQMMKIQVDQSLSNYFQFKEANQKNENDFEIE